MCIIHIVHKLLPVQIATDSVPVLPLVGYKAWRCNVFKSGQRKYFLPSL